MDKKYLKQVGLYILTSIVSIGVILYIGYHLFYGLTQRLETAPATPTTIHSVVEADVYLFREEHVLLGTSTGESVVPAVADGTRVGIGDTVARLYDGSSPDIVAAIAELDTQIAVLTEMLDNTLSVRDTVSIDRGIYNTMQKIASAGRKGDGAAALSYRTELRSALIRRGIVTGVTSDISGEITRLEAEKDALTRKLGTCRETVSVTESGYYYADTDGYESLFTAETALSMTVSDLRAMSERVGSEPPQNAVGKLVTDYTWYAACLIPTEKADNLTEGKNYSVSFPYNGEAGVAMTLARLVREGETTMLVFSTGVMPQDFSYTRFQPAVITDNAYTGLKVPASAVRVVDGVTGVYILQGSVVHYRAVQLLVEGEDWCLLAAAPEEEPPAGYQWLAQNEIVITKGRGLHEGRVLS